MDWSTTRFFSLVIPEWFWTLFFVNLVDTVFVFLPAQIHKAVGHLSNPIDQWKYLLSTFLQELVWWMLYWYLTSVFKICAAFVGVLHNPYKLLRFRNESTISIVSLKFSNDFSFSFFWKVLVVSICCTHGIFLAICFAGTNFWRKFGELGQLLEQIVWLHYRVVDQKKFSPKRQPPPKFHHLSDRIFRFCPSVCSAPSQLR